MPKPYIPNDRWSQRAQKEGYRARSVYKLIDLDERFSLLSSGMKVLDVGAAPGSWLQYVSKCIGNSGHVLGLDLQPIEPVGSNVTTKLCDIMKVDDVRLAIESMRWDRVDLILSDIAPSTSGIKDVDQWRSIELSSQVIEIAGEWLSPGGKLIMKVFRGADFDPFLKEVKERFPTVKIVAVAASRDRSREVYLVCF